MKILILSFLLGVMGFSSYAIPLEQPTTVHFQLDQKPEKMTLLANPIKDGTLKLSFEQVRSESVNVVIINSLGKRVFESKRSLNNQTQVFDVSSLASGIYFLRVNTDQSNFVKKLIVQ
ncbi:T9SS type A sorting domain-containing protein [Nonlabens agnitus]|uniref:Secretion system C-terminal sorting domain-containing protein n=1 Tax=Nonlabens agnitus TaxID=870484 RepID=A0A2S9WR44_9FLAO|nr:T9SS type A sorting domain-containing protein [Nonlabens agnitus]PRP65943.1 hypothetical protein BST86_02000 [Nonlabens agnitus]